MTYSKNEPRPPRVALVEARMAFELEHLVRRHGGEPHSVPAVRERPEDATGPVLRLIADLNAGAIDLVVLQTGVSVERLAAVAEEQGLLPDLKRGLDAAITVSRGPKPTAALAKLGVKPTATVPSPYTTGDVITALGHIRLEALSAAVVHHGERNEALANWLAGRTRVLHEVFVYRWLLPDRTAGLESLVADLVAGAYDAVAFTSQVQVRHLFRVAADLGQTARLVDAMNGSLVTAAVGPTCALALEAEGVRPDVVPVHPKMGHMVIALMERLRDGRDPAGGDVERLRISSATGSTP